MAVVVGITALPACSSLQPSLIRGASQRRAPSLLKTKFMGERLAFAVSAEISEQNRRSVSAVTAASANGLSNKLQGGLGGMGDPMDFGSSKSKFQEVPETRVSFEDVAGADQAKLELVDILKISRTTGADLQNWMVANHGTIDFSANSLVRPILAAAVAGMALVDVEAASAAGGEFGLVEGRSFALIHPIVMGGLFAYTLYAGFLGWQWRRVRTIQTDITELKKQVQKVTVAAGDTSAPPPPPSPIEAQISSLTEERKELVKGGFRDRHFNAGSILLGLGVFESVGGALNTWARTGKLFPGPHLFAGAAITISWALAASLVPAMQKGNETARNLHIGLNLLNVGLFVWQIPTGWEIVLKVFEFTSWP